MKTSSPKVLILDLSERFGGASARVLTLMQCYPHGRIALATLKDSPVSKYAQKLNLPLIIVGKWKYDIRIFFNLLRVIRSNKFDILDVQNIQSKFWGSLAIYFRKITLISTLNSWYLNEHEKTGIKGKIYTAIELLTNWSKPHYIVVSRAIYDSLCETGINPNRISLVYNAVEIDRLKLLENEFNIRSEFKIPLNSVVCIALGRLVWAKGYENLIQAFSIVKEKINNMFCIIVGGGELHQPLLEQISRNNLTNNIFLCGHLEHDVALSMLKGCDIFVMPSRSEGTPIALLEAAALGIPILATNIGGIPELVTDQEAFLVPPDNPKALAEGLMKLVKDKNFAEAISSRAKLRVDNLFSTDRQINDILNAYNMALSE